MATSPIYSWPEPDNTDLVKNGALAIRTLGDAIDTTMGTMVAKTIVDAKGDLIAATAADTVARLAVGTNGQTLVADSSTATGLKWATPSASGFVGVSAQTTTAQAISNATYTVMNIGGTDVFDTDSFHDTTTNNSRITIPSGKAGYYLLIGTVAWKDNATGERQTGLKKNGTSLNQPGVFSSGNAGGGNFTTNTVVGIVNLAVADYVEIEGRQYSGGSLNTQYVQFVAQYLGA